ncbi:GGDEF domain-containing protein [Pseudomonas matsuisoli]|uniref:diguanylate cyclase n=1 Tax=Pseudomonas matsuisoli TaxID=1515666 RepID=A0A917Q033_9PSED|nr:GGDEF domain-containing protein [Pseudomonas matsuisoli]GGK03062.1 GGDEF domain-containing protein [Pseudomonas matsuisoli]
MLDPRSIIFILSALSLLMSLVLFAMPQSIRDRLGGSRHWSAGMLMLSVAALLYGLRGLAPNWLSVSLANTAALTAVAMIYAGGRAFFDKAPANRQLIFAVGLATLALTYFTYFQDTLAARSVIFSLLSAALLYLFGRDVMRYRPRMAERAVFPYLFTGISVYFDVIVSLLRALNAFWATNDGLADLFAPTPLNVLYFSTHSLLVICISVGFILMSNERLHSLLEYQLSHDPLTNAFARPVVMTLARRELTGRKPVSMLLLDIDHFKTVNDTLGHQIGDEVLKHIVRSLNAVLRPNEPLGRYGGEEFVLLLCDADERQAGIVAERLRRCVEATPYQDDAKPYPMTVSIGCATARPGEDLEQILNRADTALYRAKHAGRNRVEHG